MKIPAVNVPVPGKGRKSARRYDVHVVLEKDDYERLQRLAANDDRAISNLVRRIIRKWLDDLHDDAFVDYPKR